MGWMRPRLVHAGKPELKACRPFYTPVFTEVKGENHEKSLIEVQEPGSTGLSFLSDPPKTRMITW